MKLRLCEGKFARIQMLNKNYNVYKDQHLHTHKPHSVHVLPDQPLPEPHKNWPVWKAAGTEGPSLCIANWENDQNNAEQFEGVDISWEVMNRVFATSLLPQRHRQSMCEPSMLHPCWTRPGMHREEELGKMLCSVCLFLFPLPRHRIEMHISVTQLKTAHSAISTEQVPMAQLLFHSQMSAEQLSHTQAWEGKGELRSLEEKGKSQCWPRKITKNLLLGYLMAYGTWFELPCESLSSQLPSRIGILLQIMSQSQSFFRIGTPLCSHFRQKWNLHPTLPQYVRIGF